MTASAELSRIRRLPDRGSHDRAAIHAVLDEGLVAVVSFCVDGQPFAIPMAYARDGDELLLHGSIASRLLQTMARGVPLCVCVTLVDGLVLARSVFHHSMNYRSVVVFGEGQAVTEPEACRVGLERLVEHLIPGRSSEARAPNRKELAATALVRLPIAQASLKARSGPPSDAAADRELPVWGGVIPLAVTAGPPRADAINTVATDESVRRWARRRDGSGVA